MKTALMSAATCTALLTLWAAPADANSSVRYERPESCFFQPLPQFTTLCSAQSGIIQTTDTPSGNSIIIINEEYTARLYNGRTGPLLGTFYTKLQRTVVNRKGEPAVFKDKVLVDSDVFAGYKCLITIDTMYANGQEIFSRVTSDCQPSAQ